jgi:IS5 family transposase
MLRDRYDPMDLFTQIPRLCLQFEPVLAHLDRLLEDDQLFAQVKADLARRSPQSLMRGRASTPVEVILRMLVVRRLYGWSYEETEHFVADSLVLRQFCRLYLEPVPDDTTLIRWANLIGPKTLERLNDHVVELARARKVTRGTQAAGGQYSGANGHSSPHRRCVAGRRGPRALPIAAPRPDDCRHWDRVGPGAVPEPDA